MIPNLLPASVPHSTCSAMRYHCYWFDFENFCHDIPYHSPTLPVESIASHNKLLPKSPNVCGLPIGTLFISAIVILVMLISIAIGVGIGTGAETSRFPSEASSTAALKGIPTSAE